MTEPKGRFQDRAYLLSRQYASPKNLEARIFLHEHFSTNPVGLHRWLLDEILPRLAPQARVLELGCGQGQLWTANADRVPTEWDITLSDFSPGMLSAAEANLAGLFPGRKHFQVADAQAIPFPDAAFDAVFAHFMLHHVPDRSLAYHEILRVLRPGGRLFTSTFGHGHLKEIYEMARRMEGRAADGWTISFRLDNGAAELRGFFSDLEIINFEDGLRVTEAEPLVDYVISMVQTGKISERRRAALREQIQAWLKRDGVIRIAKESGLLICRRPGK